MKFEDVDGRELKINDEVILITPESDVEFYDKENTNLERGDKLKVVELLVLESSYLSFLDTKRNEKCDFFSHRVRKI